MQSQPSLVRTLRWVGAMVLGLPGKAVGRPRSGGADIAEPTVEEEGGGPEDLEKRGAWIDYDERQYVKVSYCYEPRANFFSLDEFFVAQVRRTFAHVDTKYRETDVRNYVERICVMKRMSRAELAQFLSRYGWVVMRWRAPKVPHNLKSAVLCRDEPSTKEVVWETERGYWTVAWHKE
jgi:hypothetical protein